MIIYNFTAACYNNGLLYFQWSNIGAPWIISCINREKMRVVYSLPPDPCGDCLVHFWCGPCALCQEYRELTNKGFDMKIGTKLLIIRTSFILDIISLSSIYIH